MVEAAAGEKVTEMVQVPPLAATVALQLLVVPKSVGFAPARTMLLMDRSAVPALVRVTICALEVLPALVVPGKVSAEVESVAAGVPTPVPVSAMVCVAFAWLPLLSVRVIVAE